MKWCNKKHGWSFNVWPRVSISALRCKTRFRSEKNVALRKLLKDKS